MALSFAHGAIQWLQSDVATTTYTVSGLSFQPKALRFYMVGLQSATDAVSEAINQRRSIGFATSTSDRRAVSSLSVDGAATSAGATAASNDCVLATVGSTGTRDGMLDLNSITSDGFTLIVDDAIPASATVFWEAWGGTDITVAACVDISEPAAIGNQDYTVTGFTSGGTDQVVMFAGVQSTAALNSGFDEASGLCVGFATSASDQVVVGGNADDNSANMDTDGWGLAGECVGMIATAGAATVEARATLTQFGTDNFRLNWAARAVTGRKYIALAIKGGLWKAGSYTINGNSANATATVSGLTFAPVGLSLIGRMTAVQASNVSTANDILGFGSGTSTTSRRSMGTLDEDATASSACEINQTIQYDQILSFPSTAGGLQSAYDINAMNSDGFQIIVDTAGGVASEWQGYLTFGSVPVPLPNVSDATAVTDYVTLPFYIQGAGGTPVNDATAATDGLVMDLLLQPILSDSTAVTDYVTLPFYIVVSDATTITEFQAFSLAIPTVSDSTTITDAATVNFVLSPNVFDATTLDELVAVVLVEAAGSQPLTVDVGDDTTITDASLVLLPVLLPDTVFDSTAVTDDSSVSWNLTIEVNDTTAVMDDVVFLFVNPLFIPDVFDTTTVSEGLQMAIPDPPLLVSAGSDTTITDDLALMMPLNFTVNETILLDDGFVMDIKLPPLEVAVFESLTATAGKLGAIDVID